MTKLILSACAFIGTAAFAQGYVAKPNPHNIFVDVSMNRGGLGMGAGYEYMLDEAAGLGVGGHVRAYQKDRDNGANGLMIIGASSGFHFYKKAWDLSFTPSLNLMSVDSYRTSPGDATTLGPGLGIALTTQMTDRFAVGFAFNQFYVWFNSDYRGIALNDLALRGHFSF